MKTKIIIVEDHPLLNDGLKYQLQDEFEIIGQFYKGCEVLSGLEMYKPDLILLDINLPSKSGLEIVADMNPQIKKRTKIIILSMHSELYYIDKARGLKVDGYMLKNSSKVELMECISQVLRNQVFFDPKLKNLNLNSTKSNTITNKNLLSPRELEVVELMKIGLSSQKIADRLCVSQETIKTHRKNIFLKLGIKSVFELFKLASN